jgi:predicted regulator of Ras-like GTPase activity (Roadblock/LC7/MglB family)
LADLRKILEELVATGAVRACLVVGRDGFIIETAGEDAAQLEAVGAIAPSSLGAAEVIGLELAQGPMAQAMFEFEKGAILMSAVGADAILVSILPSGANLGKARYDIRKYLPAVEGAL